jgi:hypothetical protein
MFFIGGLVSAAWITDESGRGDYMFTPSYIRSTGGLFGWAVALVIGLPGFIISLTGQKQAAKAMGGLSLLLGIGLFCWTFYHLIHVGRDPMFPLLLPDRPVVEPLMWFMIVYWGPPVALGVITLVFCFTAQRRNLFPIGCCQGCGYNLTGNVSGICPECGTQVSEAEKGAAR